MGRSGEEWGGVGRRGEEEWGGGDGAEVILYIIKLVCVVPNDADDLACRDVCSIGVVCLQNLRLEIILKFKIIFLFLRLLLCRLPP